MGEAEENLGQLGLTARKKDRFDKGVSRYMACIETHLKNSSFNTLLEKDVDKMEAI